MFFADKSDIDNFIFRDIHPKLNMGTASDRYAGWVGQIYTEGKYKISSRTHKVGNKSFKEETLPVESVMEYFQHFSVLEIDFTFYMPLLSKDLKPTSNYKILQTYNKYLKNNDQLILKVPQVIFAQRFWQKGKQVENPNYLNSDMFTNQFYDPANAILGDKLHGFIFEQVYQRKADRVSTQKYIKDLDHFIGSLPEDNRYHLETRTDYYHSNSYFEMLDKHGVGHVLSHWTWLPPLRKQFIKSGEQFYSSSRQCIIRLLTPLRKNFNETYAQAYPFDQSIPGMMNPEMINETIEIIKAGISKGIEIYLIVNNRAGGNAPLIAQEIANHFV